MENLMNYSAGEIPPADLLRLFLKHGITEIPTKAVWEMYDVVKPHLSFLQKSVVSGLITGFYNPDLADLLTWVKKQRGLKPLPKMLMYDYRITKILRKYIDNEKWAEFQLDVLNFGEEETRPGGAASTTGIKNNSPSYTMNSFRNTATAGTMAITGGGAASRNSVAAFNANLLAMAPTPLPANVLGPSRTGPRRTVRNRAAVATRSNENSNENTNTNNRPTTGTTGPRRNYPELMPVPVRPVARKPLGLAIKGSERLLPSGPSRTTRSIGYKNAPYPPTLNMPKPKPTGERNLTGKYRKTRRARTQRKGLKRTTW